MTSYNPCHKKVKFSHFCQISFQDIFKYLPVCVFAVEVAQLRLEGPGFYPEPSLGLPSPIWSPQYRPEPYERTRNGFGLWAANQTKLLLIFAVTKNTITSCLKGIQILLVWTDKDLLLKHLNALMVSSCIVIPLSAESLALHHLVLQEAVEPRDLLLEQSLAARSLSLRQGRTCGCQTVWLFQLLTQTPHVFLSTGVILLPLWV